MANSEPVFKFTGRIQLTLFVVALGLLICGVVNTSLAIIYAQGYSDWATVSEVLFALATLYMGLAVFLNPDRFEDKEQ